MASEGYTAVPEQVQAERLLPKPTPQEDRFDVELGQQHQFEGGVCECCGKCDSLGWTVCALVTFASCLPFGQNASRSLGKSALKYTLLFFCLTMVVTAVHYAAVIATVVSVETACGIDEADPKMQTQVCKDALVWQSTVVGISRYVTIAVGMTVRIWGAKLRSAFRTKFNIPGSTRKDFWIWWCLPCCALCQETRTNMRQNIHNGRWNGPFEDGLDV